MFWDIFFLLHLSINIWSSFSGNLKPNSIFYFSRSLYKAGFYGDQKVNYGCEIVSSGEDRAGYNYFTDNLNFLG